MNHLFTPTQWDVIKENYTRWWAGELKRPLINMTVDGFPTDLVEPPIKKNWFTAYW